MIFILNISLPTLSMVSHAAQCCLQVEIPRVRASPTGMKTSCSLTLSRVWMAFTNSSVSGCIPRASKQPSLLPKRTHPAAARSFSELVKFKGREQRGSWGKISESGGTNSFRTTCVAASVTGYFFIDCLGKPIDPACACNRTNSIRTAFRFCLENLFKIQMSLTALFDRE